MIVTRTLVRAGTAAVVAVITVAIASCGPSIGPSTTDSSRPVGTSPAAAAGTIRPVEALQGPFDVADVVDGDTVKVSTSDGIVTVRLIGIDTPETVHPTKPVECFGPEASAEASRLMAGTRVWIELDASQGRTDRYGRTLAYVWLDDTVQVNYLMALGGFASEYTYDEPYHHRTAFVQAQRRAVADGRGLWGACRTGAAG